MESPEERHEGSELAENRHTRMIIIWSEEETRGNERMEGKGREELVTQSKRMQCTQHLTPADLCVDLLHSVDERQKEVRDT